MGTTRSFAVIAVALSLASIALPRHAEACGGCFAPTANPTVVTRHEMAVVISPTATTLWDQIEYAGAPEDFVWVLPVNGGVAVELADNAFFEALEQATTITLQGTFPPLRSFCNDPCGSFGASGGSPTRAFEDDGTNPPPVVVHYQATIGPYETATIGSTDPAALVAWLNDHGYEVPESILPTIGYYVEQGMDFAVLRLAPNAGVNQMQPVRVTMPGLSPIFPLRMVAAGVQDKVGLDLFIFAEGRYEAANFANAEVERSRLVYDWATTTFNYDELWDEAALADSGRAWVTEFARSTSGLGIESYSSTGEDGVRHDAMDDYAVVRQALSNPYLTRMTADLAARYLDQDLVLQASMGPDLESFVGVSGQVNRPSEPRCPTTCSDPFRAGAGGTVDPIGLGFRDGGRADGVCSVSPGRSGGPLFGLGLVVAALVAALRRRRVPPRSMSTSVAGATPRS